MERPRPLCRHKGSAGHSRDGRQRKQTGRVLEGKVFAGRGGGNEGTRTGEAALLAAAPPPPPRVPAAGRQPPRSPTGWGRGWGGGGGWSPPGGRPVQGAAWGKLGGRIVISVGVLLNYTTSYLSPGGAAGGQTDGWTDRRGRGDPSPPEGQGGWGGPGRPPLRW